MQWSNVCFCLLLMDIFGTAGVLLFQLLMRWLNNARAGVRLVFVKVIICLYLIPVIYPVLLLSRVRYSLGSWIHVGEFGLHLSEQFDLVFRLIATFWVSGLLIGASVSLYHYSRLDRILQWNAPLTTEGWKRSVEKHLKKYHLGSVKVYQNESVETTLVTGLIKPMIIVPAREYSEKQMSMMMEHEAWHVRRKDLLWKKLALIVTWLHWFNPLVYKLRAYLSLQQELVCDCCVCDVNRAYTPKEYCQFLYDVEVRDVDRMFTVTLIETGLSLEQRIKEVSRRDTLIRLSGKKILVCVIAFLITASIPAFAMAQGVVHLEETLRDSSEILIEEEPQEPEPLLRGWDDGSVREAQTGLGEEQVVQTEVSVLSGIRYLFLNRDILNGERLMVAVVCDDPELPFRMGVKNTKTGELFYLEGTEALVLNFTAETDGTYCVYLENCGDVTGELEVTIFYP